MVTKQQQIEELKKSWAEDSRWNGIVRPYTAEDVVKLRGSIQIEYTLAKRGADRLFRSIHERDFVNALGALTGNQAVQQVKAGLQAIYLSGWQVAADANSAGQMYPDQSLYPVDSVPNVVKKINQALQRADQIDNVEGTEGFDWFAPIVADAEAGFGGPLNVFELMKSMIEAGAAGVHFEDQLASEKKCGHLGGKVLQPTQNAVRNLVSARLASDVLGVPTVLIARTDADAADSIRLTILSSPVNGRLKVSTAPMPALTKRLHADWRTRLMQIWSGVKPPIRIWKKRSSLQMPSMRNSQASFWLTTVHLLSTGKRNWTKKPLRNTKSSLARWATNSNSSRLPDSMH
jgi:isocitrate lyase